MNKILKAMLVVSMVLFMAAPALAEINVNGYFRTQATGEDFSLSKDGNSSSFVDNRFRAKITNTLNDNIKLVYYGEVDTPWGEAGRAATGGGSGGQLNADGVNIETKHVYANYKASNFDVTIGVQGFSDHTSSLIMDNDAAGITFKTQQGAVDLALMYSKLYQNNRDNWDDYDFYGLQTGFTIKDTHRVGFDVLYFDNNAVAGGEVTQVFYSLNGDFKLGDAGITGWFLYGTEDTEGNPSTDGSNWAANLKFSKKLSKGDMSVCAIYIAPADKAEDVVLDDDHDTAFEFYNEGLSIFLSDVYYTSYGTQGALHRNASDNGYGLMSLSGQGKINLPSDMYLNCALGIFMSADDTAYNNAATKREGSYMGTEIDVMVGKKFAEKYDLSLRGAYAMLGDFYDNTASGSDPENPWKVVAMLNISY